MLACVNLNLFDTLQFENNKLSLNGEKFFSSSRVQFSRRNASALHYRSLLSLECVCVCPCMCVYVCMCVCMPRWWLSAKQLEINSPVFHPLVGNKNNHPPTYSPTLQLIILIYFLKVKDSNRDHFGRYNHDYIVNGDRPNIVFANI